MNNSKPSYNKKLFSCLEGRMRDFSNLGRPVEEINYDDRSLNLICIGNERYRDYNIHLYVTPKEDKITLGMLHDYDLGPVSKEHRKEAKQYLEENMPDVCHLEDEYEAETGKIHFEVDCEGSTSVPKKNPETSCKEIINENTANPFEELTQEIWNKGSSKLWRMKKVTFKKFLD